jgi:hypothetical protein
MTQSAWLDKFYKHTSGGLFGIADKNIQIAAENYRLKTILHDANKINQVKRHCRIVNIRPK